MSTADFHTLSAGPGARTVKRFSLFGLLFLFTALALTRHAQAKTSGWISTCDGVGCHGGQVGCYWYQARGLELIMYCYGVRP